MLLEELYDYKDQLVEDLMTNPDIVKLLTDDETLINNPKPLVYSQVFPFEYIPETIEQANTFICIDVDIQKSLNSTFLIPTIYVWVFTHKSKMRLPEGGVRVDKLCSEINKTINGSRLYGLGELNFYSSRRFAPIADYQGKVLTFMTKEFNRTSLNSKPIPPSRKG